MKTHIYSLLFLAFFSCHTIKNKTITEEKMLTETIKTPPKSMNTLGLIGGTSWHSTIEYYAAINQSINDYYGNNTNPPLLVYTLNQAEIHKFQKINKWDSIANMLTQGALSLKKAGAKSVMFCANTPHKVYNQVQSKLDFPIIHIADATAKAIHKKNIKRIAFLGTIYTMEGDFITGRIAENGIDVLVPKEKEVLIELQRIIEEELTYGNVTPDSKTYVLNVIKDLENKGAEGIVLGCTEFPLMIFPEDLKIPVFNTTKIHANTGVDYILNHPK